MRYFIIKNQLRLFPDDNPQQLILKDIIYDDLRNTANAETKYRDRYSHDFNDELRQKIRERDGYICQLDTYFKCGVRGSKTLQQSRTIILDVHHINYDRWDCSESNLITLCRSCHSKTNSRARTAWKLVLNATLSNDSISVPPLFL